MWEEVLSHTIKVTDTETGSVFKGSVASYQKITCAFRIRTVSRNFIDVSDIRYKNKETKQNARSIGKSTQKCHYVDTTDSPSVVRNRG